MAHFETVDDPVGLVVEVKIRFVREVAAVDPDIMTRLGFESDPVIGSTTLANVYGFGVGTGLDLNGIPWLGSVNRRLDGAVSTARGTDGDLVAGLGVGGGESDKQQQSCDKQWKGDG